MPGVRPVIRRRRLAPVPCLARSKATNFIINSSKNPPRPVWLRVSKIGCTTQARGDALDATVSCLKQLVLVGEQTHDRLTAGNALNRFCDQRCHGELANFFAGAAASLKGMVLVTTTSSRASPLANALNRRAREHGVCAIGVHLFGTTCLSILQRL